MQYSDKIQFIFILRRKSKNQLTCINLWINLCEIELQIDRKGILKLIKVKRIDESKLSYYIYSLLYIHMICIFFLVVLQWNNVFQNLVILPKKYKVNNNILCYQGREEYIGLYSFILKYTLFCLYYHVYKITKQHNKSM